MAMAIRGFGEIKILAIHFELKHLTKNRWVLNTIILKIEGG